MKVLVALRVREGMHLLSRIRHERKTKNVSKSSVKKKGGNSPF